MNVGELKEILARVPDDRLVVMSRDAEGNGYSPLSEADADARYEPESTWSGDVLHPDDYPDGYPDYAAPCVALWPVN